MAGIRRKQKEFSIHPSMHLIENRAGDSERRLYTLLLKGVIVYLVVMGQTGCLLSALSINYDIFAVNAGILLGAIFCALLYYSRVWENLGYILLFIFMLASAIAMRNYISSGFFAIVNNMAEKAAIYFGTSVIQGFRERLSDRYMTVTVSCIYIGWVNAILFNVIISRRMKYIIATALSALVLFLPFYLEREPSLPYTVMLASGLVMTYIYRGGGHYAITNDNQRYILNTKKNKINFVYDARTGWTTLAMVVVVCLAVTGGFGILYPKERYASVRQDSAWKEATHESAENLYKLGIWGIFNLYPNTGGLSSGVLGGVNSVQLDYETDLKVTMVPYVNQRVYLRSFTGASYQPFSNRWNRKTINDQPAPEETRTELAEKLRDIYRVTRDNSNTIHNDDNIQDTDNKSAKAKIRVENIDAPIGVYLPYYVYSNLGADEFVINPNQSKIMEFYPLLESIGDEDTSENIEDIYLEIPQENIEAIDGFIKEISSDIDIEKPDRDGDTDIDISEFVDGLRKYFYKNMPYSYQPGLTPYKKDFINYFLTENKKGYCAHFASAATLVFRRLGIPARYIEGYVVDPSDIAQDSSLASGVQSEDYYEGYNPIGEQPVVEVEITDASSHAWVEVYDEAQGGWVIADVTPPSDEDGPGIGLFAGLLRLLSGQDSSDTDVGGADVGGITDTPDASGVVGMADSFGRAVGVFFLGLIAIAGAVILIRISIRKIRYGLRYAKADRSGRLVMDYERYRSKVKTMPKDLINYRSQLSWLEANGYLHAENGSSETDDVTDSGLIDILEYAAFSGKEITEEQYGTARAGMRRE